MAANRDEDGFFVGCIVLIALALTGSWQMGYAWGKADAKIEYLQQKLKEAK